MSVRLSLLNLPEQTLNEHPRVIWGREKLAGRGPIGDLLLAAYNDDPEAAERALRAGAPIDGEDGYGETPLRLAARQDNSQVLAWLLDHGASVDRAGRDGATALIRALWSYHPDDSGCVALLMSRGANPNARHSWADDGDPARDEDFLMPEGELPWGVHPIRAFDASERATGDTALMISSGAAHASLATHMLLGAGADPNATNRHGLTALMLAAREGFQDVSRILLAYGARANARDQKGRAPADFIARKDRTGELFREIRAAQALADAQDLAQTLPLGNDAHLVPKARI